MNTLYIICVLALRLLACSCDVTSPPARPSKMLVALLGSRNVSHSLEHSNLSSSNRRLPARVSSANHSSDESTILSANHSSDESTILSANYSVNLPVSTILSANSSSEIQARAIRINTYPYIHTFSYRSWDHFDGKLLGIIMGSLFGAVFFLIILFCCIRACLLRKQRPVRENIVVLSNRQTDSSINPSSDSMPTGFSSNPNSEPPPAYSQVVFSKTDNNMQWQARF
ncbi:uncharacterized protein LOC131945190 [Physella acuta]|uniref:uncharacterized protein LOC131945190 n=1 Tax=Physella acuta TaxID=109671 RepID=UPI0027DC31D4|nr:uncharacterized protein LOC131945190 [Physella acuta]